MTRLLRLAVLTTHPVQYFVPLLRRIALEPDIELTVFYASAASAKTFLDPGFGREIAWDVPLLDGYKHEILPAWGGKGAIGVWRPFGHGLAARLRRDRFDYLLIHGYGRPAHWLAALTARLQGIKILIRDEATPISRQRGILKRLLKRVFFKLLERIAAGFMVIGTLNRDYYLANGISPQRLFLMPYAVDNARFQSCGAGAGLKLRGELGIPENAPVILFASKLQPRKHPDDLLEAFLSMKQGREEPPAHLVFVGDGELMAPLRNRTAEMTDVHFLGFRNQTELAACYAMCDVFVLPSSEEPWGLVVNEAMNLAKPVVVSDQAGCAPDLVRHGINGFVFPAGDVKALRTFLDLLCRDPVQARAMGQAGLKIVSAWNYEADVKGLRQAMGLPPSAVDGGR